MSPRGLGDEIKKRGPFDSTEQEVALTVRSPGGEPREARVPLVPRSSLPTRVENPAPLPAR